MTAGRDPRGAEPEVAPPLLPRLLLSLLLVERYREPQLGDLDEGFAARVSTAGLGAARRWYWAQALTSVLPALRLRVRGINETHEREGNSMETFWQDLRQGVRSLIKNPGFATVSTTTLALAIGVNTAIFSLVAVILFADLPMQDAETVTVVRQTHAERGFDNVSVSYPDYLDLKENLRSFESLSAMTEDQWVLTGNDEPTRVDGYRVSDNLLDTWRLPTVLGRGFLPGEDVPGSERVAILAHGFWQGYFGGRQDVLGSSIRLDGQEHTIVGVMSPEMEFANFSEAEVWLPLGMDRNETGRDQRVLYVTGRLADGISQEQAVQEIATLGAALVEEHPVEHEGWGFRGVPMKEGLLNDDGRMILTLLSLTVGFVLLIACANVANMLLARATARTRELAVRSALGARRARLVRQLLTEAFLIAAVASVAGLGLAKALMEGLILISAGTEQVFLLVETDFRVLLFTLGVSLVTPVLFGLIPAWRASSGDVGEALKEGTSRSGGRSGNRLRGTLAGAQVALALMLMVVAGLLVHSVINLQARALGFDPYGVLSLRIDLPEGTYGDDEAITRFYASLEEEMSGMAGVEAVGMVSFRPSFEFSGQRSLEIEGRVALEAQDRPQVVVATASVGYMEAIDIPLLQGRDFSTEDGAGTPPVALVSQEMARRYWEGQEALGQRIRLSADGDAPWLQVVGVVDDVRAGGDTDVPDPFVYIALAQNPRARMVVMLRTPTDPAALAGAAREAVWAVDGQLPVDDVRTMERVMYESEASRLSLLTLFTTFAVFALAMAAIGIYGVMSYSVSQRASEIGIRMALGAEGESVRWMILGQGARVLALGGMVGMLGAFGLSRLMGTFMFGMETTDPTTFIGVPAVLGLVALLANYLPARRATRIDPMSVLRVE